MKKFLTVLLALSVVFTYSFSSVGAVFAETKTYDLGEIEAAIYAQAQKNVNDLDTVKTNFLTNYAQNKVSINDVEVSKAAMEKVIDDVFKDIKTLINDAAVAQKIAAKEYTITGTPAEYAEYTGAWSSEEKLYLDEKGTEPATTGNSFTLKVWNNEDLTSGFDAGLIYNTNFVQLTGPMDPNGPGSWTPSVTEYNLKNDVTWYKETTPAVPFRGHFTEEEKAAYEAEINKVYIQYDTALEIKDYIVRNADKYGEDALTAMYAIEKSEVLAEIAKVDLIKYNDNVPADADTNSKYYVGSSHPLYGTLGEGYYSFRAQVAAYVEMAKDALDGNDPEAKAELDEIADAIEAIEKEDDWTKTNLLDKIKDIPTAQDEVWDAEDLENGKARITAAMKAHLSELKALEYDALSKAIRELERETSLTDAEKKLLAEKKEALAALDGDYVALEEVYVNQIKQYKKTDVEAFFVMEKEDEDYGKLIQNKIVETFKAEKSAKELATLKLDKIADLKTEADRMKAEISVDGSKVYDNDAVDKALAAAIDEVYIAKDEDAVKTVKLDVDANIDFVKDEMRKVLGTDALRVELDKKFYDTVAAWENAATDKTYDEAHLKEVKAVIADAKAAIRAAKTVAEVDAAFVSAYAKYDAVLTLKDRDDAQKEKEYQAAITEYSAKIKAALASKKILLGDAEWAKLAIKTDLEGSLIGDSLNDKGLYAAYNAAEIASIADEALKVIENLKEQTALDAEAKAITEAIMAVKVPVTAADKDTVLALKERVENFEAYLTDVAGGKLIDYAIPEAYLGTLVNDIKAFDAEAIKDAAAEIMKDGKVTLEEEAAVEALQALVDAYEENYGETFTDTTVNKVLATDFIALKVDALEKAIAVIDPTAKPLDVKAIEAARAAYDALGEVGIDPTAYTKLLALERLVKEYTIAAVRAFQISTTTQLVKGQKMIVKWNVIKGDESAIDGYRVYYSTKKSNAGFKVLADVKGKKLNHTSIKNNKSIKKGTRVYYRVKAYKMIDGLRYLSAYSSAGHRTWK